MRADPTPTMRAAIRQRLILSGAVTALVAADSIKTGDRPEAMPCVLVGQSQTVHRRFDATNFHTLHVWAPALTDAEGIVGAMTPVLTVDAQIDGPLRLDGFLCRDLAVTNSQIVRDQSGAYHGIVTVAGKVQER